MSNTNIEFSANEITRATESAGLSSGYMTLMADARGMSQTDQKALTQDLTKNGILPELSFAYLDSTMQNNGVSSMDKQAVTDLQSSADKSGSPLQAALADDVAASFGAAAETRRLPVGRYGELTTAIFADTLDDKMQSLNGIGSPPESDSTVPAPGHGATNPGNDNAAGGTATGGAQAGDSSPLTEQVKAGDSYWSVAERALGLDNGKPLDRTEDKETFDLMKNLQSDNGNAVLQPGEIVTIQASDMPQIAQPAADNTAAQSAAQPTSDNAAPTPTTNDYTADGPATPAAPLNTIKGLMSWL